MSVRERIKEYVNGGNWLTRKVLQGMGIDSLRGIDLSNLDLREADLSNMDLREADLSNTDLKGADLGNTDLRGANLSNTKLMGANLSRSKLTGANLKNTNLENVNLKNANLKNANLSGANLEYANLNGVNLEYANLQGAQLKDITGCFDIAGASLDKNTKISWSWEWLYNMASTMEGRDACFNHKNNLANSVFTTINDLSDTDAKVKCLEQVAKIILQKNLYLEDYYNYSIIHELAIPLMDSLFKEDAYTDAAMGAANKSIRKLADELIVNIFKSDQCFYFKSRDSSFHKILLHYIENKIQGEDQTWIQDHNTQIQCCLHILSKSEDQEIQEKALALKTSVYQMDFLKEICAQYQSDNCLEEDDLLRDSLIFISKDQKQAVAVERPYFDKYYLDEPITNSLTPQDMFFYKKMGPGTNLFWKIFPYKKKLNEKSKYENQHARDILKILKPWPSLHQRIGPYISDKIFLSVLQEIFDNTKTEYRDLFQKAVTVSAFDKNGLTVKKLTEKKLQLIDVNNQEKLIKYFSNFYSEDTKISEKHLENLLQIADLTDAKPYQKSYYLAVLSAIFSKYSSSAFFGSEFDSPQALRAYANALLQAAREIGQVEEPDTNKKFKIKEADYKDWSNRLTGEPDSFSCTGVLFLVMLPVLKKLSKNPELRYLFEIIPAAWR